MKDGYKRTTRADVAKLAGVSETIVSYVINNNRYVDKTKKILVEKAIKELNYVPNNAARALKGRNSNHIVFIADQITNEHFSTLISEMDKYAYDKGGLISLCSNRNTEKFVSQIISRQYDGIIISSISFPEEFIQKFIYAKIPVVILKNRDYKTIENAGIIETGLYTGAKKSVNYLVSKNRKNILYIDRFSKRGNYSTMNDFRYRGFVNAITENNINLTNQNIITNCVNSEDVSLKIKERIESGFKVDAIFGRNDIMACIAMKTVQKMGYIVPKDISIIGFDNSSLSLYTSPTLTTINVQRDKIGRTAIEMLYQIKDTGKIPKQISFETQLIEREST